MLHIHGGSVVLDKLRAAGLPGQFLEWCDVLCQGPTPADLDADAWRAARAAWLEQAFGATNGRRPLERLVAQDQALRQALNQDEIALWFSADWFCQAILVHLLPRLAGSAAKLSLISIGTHPGVDDGKGCTLAFLSDEQLARLFEHRPTVTGAQIRLARRTREALCAPTPEPLFHLIQEDTAALPFLGPGLQRHLRELPAPHVGLGLTEFRVLEALGGRTVPFAELFPAVAHQEERRWITDLMLWGVVRELAAGAVPLLAVGPEARLLDSRIRLTAHGRDVLAGRADAIRLRGIDKWIGGVHLTPGAVWRWDDRAKRLIHD